MKDIKHLSMEALVKWTDVGRRAFEIRYSKSDKKPRIEVWVYSFTHQTGTFLTQANAFPSDEFFERKRKEDIKARLANLTEEERKCLMQEI